MTIATDQALYRARTFYRKEAVGRGHRYSLEMLDELTQQVMATCDLTGRATFAVLALVDEQQRVWRMGPNRKIMPSRWIVTDPQQRVVMQFERSILGKLSNPLHKVAFSRWVARARSSIACSTRAPVLPIACWGSARTTGSSARATGWRQGW